MITVPEISIIVPIYNVEAYIRQCLDSIEAQTFTDWECILVDDGTPDSSAAIAEEYTRRDPRFKLLHRANGGLSAARNTGLREARGKYVGFVDSDDWLHPAHFATLHHLITAYGTDMAQVGFKNEYKGYTRGKTLTDAEKRIDRKEILSRMLTDRMPDYVWNKLFRREVALPEFPEGKVFEDIAVFNVWMARIRSAALSPEMTYHYRRRRGSIVNSRYSQSRLDFLNVACDRATAFRTIGSGETDERLLTRYLWHIALMAAKEIARFEPDAEVQRRSLELIRQRALEFPKPTVKALGLKKWWRGRTLIDDATKFASRMRLVYKTDIQMQRRSDHLFE